MSKNEAACSSSIGGDHQRSICRDYMNGLCRRSPCMYHHPPGQGQDDANRKHNFVFCYDYRSRGCTRTGCRFIHCSVADQAAYACGGSISIALAKGMLASGQCTPDNIGGKPICEKFLIGKCPHDRQSLCQFWHIDPQIVESCLAPYGGRPDGARRVIDGPLQGLLYNKIAMKVLLEEQSGYVSLESRQVQLPQYSSETIDTRAIKLDHAGSGVLLEDEADMYRKDYNNNNSYSNNKQHSNIEPRCISVGHVKLDGREAYISVDGVTSVRKGALISPFVITSNTWMNQSQLGNVDMSTLFDHNELVRFATKLGATKLVDAIIRVRQTDRIIFDIGVVVDRTGYYGCLNSILSGRIMFPGVCMQHLLNPPMFNNRHRRCIYEPGTVVCYYATEIKAQDTYRKRYRYQGCKVVRASAQQCSDAILDGDGILVEWDQKNECGLISSEDYGDVHFNASAFEGLDGFHIRRNILDYLNCSIKFVGVKLDNMPAEVLKSLSLPEGIDVFALYVRFMNEPMNDTQSIRRRSKSVKFYDDRSLRRATSTVDICDFKRNEGKTNGAYDLRKAPSLGHSLNQPMIAHVRRSRIDLDASKRMIRATLSNNVPIERSRPTPWIRSVSLRRGSPPPPLRSYIPVPKPMSCNSILGQPSGRNSSVETRSRVSSTGYDDRPTQLAPLRPMSCLSLSNNYDSSKLAKCSQTAPTSSESYQSVDLYNIPIPGNLCTPPLTPQVLYGSKKMPPKPLSLSKFHGTTEPTKSSSASSNTSKRGPPKPLSLSKVTNSSTTSVSTAPSAGRSLESIGEKAMRERLEDRIRITRFILGYNKPE